jgi:hypothetical protein
VKQKRINKKGEKEQSSNYQVKTGSKTLVYKVKASGGAPTGETDKSTSPDQEPKAAEDFAAAEYGDDDYAEEEEHIRRKNSEDENSELLRQAASQ